MQGEYQLLGWEFNCLMDFAFHNGLHIAITYESGMFSIDASDRKGFIFSWQCTHLTAASLHRAAHILTAKLETHLA